MMSFTERTYGALRVSLLVLALSAVVWPVTQYSARRELLSRVGVPAAAEETIPQRARLFWSGAEDGFLAARAVVVSAESAPLSDRHLKRQTSVYAAVPTYEAALLLCAVDQVGRVYTDAEPFNYVSYCIAQPSDRGPPSFV
ncbi:MAG TPA: hypothetical protein VGX92_05475 [Pyrinomonadaceae bacterium]|jgi:hypothetical protein|nr:hypothetical protein [Pyrinomonadaceae bacterium]